MIKAGFSRISAPRRRGVNRRKPSPLVRVALAGSTVIAWWTPTHSIFAVRYAHEYYGDRAPGPARADRGGLALPREAVPDYWDFLYFSVVVGMTWQVSDVQVTARRMRPLILIHGVASFAFNTVVLALAVGIVAGTIRVFNSLAASADHGFC